jgi:hypothetical protein
LFRGEKFIGKFPKFLFKILKRSLKRECFKKPTLLYKNSLVTSELYVAGSIKEYAALTSFTNELLKEAVSALGMVNVFDLFRKNSLYKCSLFDKISFNIDMA